ncbi:MAG: hypothetical protein K8S27_15965 [Candidatus Omnitrophica bacterium]|nr:hypothetical protein [Candidatus Omnitrophota bacterium]
MQRKGNEEDLFEDTQDIASLLYKFIHHADTEEIFVANFNYSREIYFLIGKQVSLKGKPKKEMSLIRAKLFSAKKDTTIDVDIYYIQQNNKNIPVRIELQTKPFKTILSLVKKKDE